MTLLELVTILRDRYQVYAGEYKKPNLYAELELLQHTPRPSLVGLGIDIQLFQLINTTYPTVEFLVHSNCFHPDIDMWMNCPDTTSAEIVVLFNECIDILNGVKKCPDVKSASSVSIVPES